MPAMTAAQTAGWLALLDLRDRLPTGWTLVGGQMVHLHCAERGVSPARPTDDADAVLDVRAQPRILHAFTEALSDLGFTADGRSWEGHEHRWKRDPAQIDVLVPRGIGARAAARLGVGGGTTVQTPGAQQALNRSQDVDVIVAERMGVVPRPSLLGALVAKAAAHTVATDPNRRRHLIDFAVLTTLIAPSDHIEAAGKRDRSYLTSMIGALVADKRTLLSVEEAPGGLETLRLALGLA
jgi:hypothetical protein